MSKSRYAEFVTLAAALVAYNDDPAGDFALWADEMGTVEP